MDPFTIGIVSIALLLCLVLLGLHTGIALAAVGLGGVFIISGRLDLTASLLTTTAFSSVNDYIFAVVPLFVVMGLFATASGATRDLFVAADMLIHRVRGGLGISTVVANAVFAATTGVSIASAAVFSKLSIPEMTRLGYQRKFGLGIVASSALLGMLIPPSVLMILWAVTTEESIGQLFAAGIGPGLLVVVALSLTIYLRARLNPELTGAEGTSLARQLPRGSIFVALWKVWPIVALIGLVLGGIYGGWFTPTEAGAVGAAGALLVVVIKRKFSTKSIGTILLETGATTASVLFLICMAQVYSRMLTFAQVPTTLASMIVGMDIPPILVVVLFCAVLLALGCFIDSSSIVLLTAPIMAPVVAHLGYDVIWFGIVAIVTIELGLLTPPFGMVVFAMKASLPGDVKLDEIFAGSTPFFVVLLAVLGILIAVPEITLFLPRLLIG